MFTSRPLVLAGLGGAGLLLLAACGSGSSSSNGAASGGSSSASSASSGGYGGYAGSSKHSAKAAPARAGSAVSAGSSKIGPILVDPHKMTLYAFAADTKGHSNCTGSCLHYWPAVPASAMPKSAPAGVSATFGSTKGTNGAQQLTVNGYPVYTYVGDSAPGQANGQGTNLSGGLWWAVSPNGSWDKRTG